MHVYRIRTKSAKCESQSHSQTISETPSTILRIWEWNLFIAIEYWMFCSKMHDIFVIQMYIIFLTDTTRKPRPGEVDGRGKSVCCYKLKSDRYVGSSICKEGFVLKWQLGDSSVTNLTTEMLVLKTGSHCELNLGPLELPMIWPMSFNHQASIASFPGLHPHLILQTWR